MAYNWCGGIYRVKPFRVSFKNNQKVVGLDNYFTGFKKNLGLVKKMYQKTMEKFYFNKGNIENYYICLKACKKTDYVLHQAAIGSVPRSIKPNITNRSNVNGLNILDAAKNSKVKKFVYTSVALFMEII